MSTEAALGASQRIGRSFSLSTFVPAVALILWLAAVYALAPTYGAALSWPEAEDLTFSWVETSAVIGAFIILSLAIHPLVFVTTQILEGYWGHSWVGRWLATIASRRHRQRIHDLERTSAGADDEIRRLAHEEAVARGVTLDDDWVQGWLDEESTLSLHRWIVTRDSADKTRQNYPESASRAMPTRLGNTLRREEDRQGAQYGLDALTVAGHLAFVVPPNQGEYLRDARQQMDSAVQLCGAGLLAFIATTAWLLPAGWSLSISLAPFGFAYLSYRAAVSAAQDYMFAFGVLIDLNRFTLYRALHMAEPCDSSVEGEQNRKLIQLLSGIRTNVGYEHSPAVASD